MTHADERGRLPCTGPAVHAISARTAHTTTTSSIDRVPKTVGRRRGTTHRVGRLSRDTSVFSLFHVSARRSHCSPCPASAQSPVVSLFSWSSLI